MMGTGLTGLTGEASRWKNTQVLRSKMGICKVIIGDFILFSGSKSN